MYDQVVVVANQMEVSRLLIRYGTTSLNKLATVSFHHPRLVHMWLIHSFQSVAISMIHPSRLETITVQRDWFRFLAEECELDWTEDEAFLGDAAHRASLYAFVIREY